MDFSVDTSNINMEAPIQDKSLPIKDIKDFPSKQAEAIQKHLLELDEQRKLFEYFKEQYPNLGAENSLANYILKNWEKDGKRLYLEWTGIEVYKENKTLVKAIGIKLNEVSCGSGKYFLWKCSTCQCEWAAIAYARVSLNSNCPACSGNQLIIGANDLLTWCNANGAYGTKLKSEFVGLDKDNQPIKIEEISRGSSIKVWWKCSKCHKIWIAAPHSRTGKSKSGCIYCNKNGTSFPEQYIYHSLLQLFPKTQNRQNDKLLNYEYDIVIPELNLCLEYSGYNWHQDKLDHDIEKEEHCKYNGVQFLQIYAHNGVLKEDDTYTPSQIVYRVNTDKTLHIIQLQQIIKFILEQYSESALYDKINFTISE